MGRLKRGKLTDTGDDHQEGLELNSVEDASVQSTCECFKMARIPRLILAAFLLAGRILESLE